MHRAFNLFLVFIFIGGCTVPQENPFYNDYQTLFQTPPFEKIREDHYLPAFQEGMKQQQQEVQVIVNNPENPTFQNTIEALESTGQLLNKVSSVFYNLFSAHTNEEIQRLSKEVAPMLSRHRDDILMNQSLFHRVKAVYAQQADLDLEPEQGMLLEKTYKDFVRSGANLSEDKKKELRAINQRLSELSLQFGENILKETNAFEMVIEKESELAGLPASAVSAAAEAGEERGHPGKWVFTLHNPSRLPFLQYSEVRELREKLFRAYINLGNNGNKYDNKSILQEMVNLRLQRANLLGYATHAHFVLEENMAKDPGQVYDLLNQVWKPTLIRAKSEARAIQEMIRHDGADFPLQPWDWWYYSEKVRKMKYDLDDEILRPYFQLEKVRQGAFAVANKLWGITFTPRSDIPVYHPDVRVFEVKESDGSHIGILYTDYFPRASKRSGAWMNSFREQYVQGDQMITPVISNVFNFTKPTADTPALLSLDEVETLFHEFGHALHGLLSRCTYRSLSGTDVPRDFVELPSQIMENWALHPEVLKTFARHYQTDEPIPDELIEKIGNSAKFNQGFEYAERLAASFVDMDWHTVTRPVAEEVMAFEVASLSRIGMIPQIVTRYRSPYFRHIFSGGYSAGYYSYTWAEVLDSHAFQAFQKNGLFDQATANSYRENILARGGTEDPMTLYFRFRGAEPEIQPLLEKRGLD